MDSYTTARWAQPWPLSSTLLVHSNYLPLSIRGATISLASEFKTGVKTRRLKLGSCLNPSSFATCLTPVDLLSSLQYLSCQCFGTITIHVSRIYEVYDCLPIFVLLSFLFQSHSFYLPSITYLLSLIFLSSLSYSLAIHISWVQTYILSSS